VEWKVFFLSFMRAALDFMFLNSAYIPAVTGCVTFLDIAVRSLTIT
jgi:hypothetical protein